MRKRKQKRNAITQFKETAKTMMMKYITPLLLATLFVRSLAQEFDGPSEYTIGQGWDATGVEGVFQDECVIQDKAACEEQATRLGYKFLEAGSAVVKGCFLRFPLNDNVKVPFCCCVYSILHVHSG